MSWPLTIEPLPGDRYVVRDDLIPGGSKRRSLERWMKPENEYVFAGPGQGYAHVALAATAQATGSRVTAVVADRKKLLPNTATAEKLGAKLIRVRPGYLTVVKARAREYAEGDPSRVLLPLGLDHPEFRPNMVEALLTAVEGVAGVTEVWSAAGSGALACCLQVAFPDAAHFAIQVGRELRQEDVGEAEIVQVPEDFSQGARKPPPFPSTPNYDAKIWQAFEPRAKAGALYWNVAAT